MSVPFSFNADQREIEKLVQEDQSDPQKPLHTLLNQKQKNYHVFRDAMKVAGLSVIALIDESEEALKKVHAYSKAGVAAIALKSSSSRYPFIEKVVSTLSSLHPCPIISMETIIHSCQMAKLKHVGVAAVLVKVDSFLNEWLELGARLGLDVIVCVTNDEELKTALLSNPEIIAIFNANLEWAEKASSQIDKKTVKIYGAGINSLEEAQKLHLAGYHGLLLSTFLEQSKDFQQLISEIGNV